MKKLLLALILIMSISVASANNNEDDKKEKESKIEKAELNKQLDLVLFMSKKNFVKSVSLNQTYICHGPDGVYIYAEGGKYYMTSVPVYYGDEELGGTELYPPLPPTQVTFSQINATCSAPGGSWES